MAVGNSALSGTFISRPSKVREHCGGGGGGGGGRGEESVLEPEEGEAL